MSKNPLPKKYFRPEWTCGRYHKEGKVAIMYNLMEGMCYLFEDYSAQVIGAVLKTKKNGSIDVKNIAKDSGIDVDSVLEFFEELRQLGLVSESHFSKEKIKEIRNKVGLHRITQRIETERTVQERLPFAQDTVENSYMQKTEKFNTPFSVMFELTYNCNEKCLHCYNPGATRNDSEISKRNRKELNLNDYKKIIDDLAQMGVVKIVLTGGEPFVKKDIWSIIEYVFERDFSIDIYTNGIALEGSVEKLAGFYPRTVGLSVYSAREEIHDRITRTKGSLNKTLTTAKKLVDYGIPLYFKCPIMNINADSYFTVYDISKYYGALTQFDISLTNSIDGDISITKNLQVRDELLEIILRDSTVPLYVGKEAPNYGSQKKDLNSDLCGAGKVFLNITPEGEVTPCSSFPTSVGNIKLKSIKEIWESSEELRYWRRLKLSDYEQCGRSERCSFCNRCVGQSFIEHGTPLKNSTDNCHMANARMLLAKKLNENIDPIKSKSVRVLLEEKQKECGSFNLNKISKENFRNNKLRIIDR
jgi:radical SAM protein with 4Fe4S-binding SPASM domain